MLIATLHILVTLFQVVFVLVSITAFAAIITSSVSLLMGVPYVRTYAHSYAPIAAALHIEPGDVVYELGSGDGGFSLYLSHSFPNARFVGIERNPILYVLAHIRRFLQGSPKNVSFKREDFFIADFTSATKIYAYLLPQIMDKLLPKCERELHRARLVSRAFQFSKKTPRETVRISKRNGLYDQQMLYVYEFTK